MLAPVAALALLSLAPAQDGWVQWSGNGHYYLAVHRPGGRTWAEARAEAQQMGGDLASIANLAENAFVFSLVDAPRFWRTASNPTRVLGPWLGGFQSPGTTNPSANWNWVSGEPWSLSRWSNGEPNDWQGNQEDRLQFFALGPTPLAYWNDLVGGSQMLGFVVEVAGVPPAWAVSFGSDCGTTPPQLEAISLPLLGTPQLSRIGDVPASIALMTAGLAVVTTPPLLDGLGLTGCKLYHDLLYLSGPLPLTGPTTAEHAFPIPNDPALVTTLVHLQGIVLAPGANPASLLLTRPMTLSLGDH